MKLYMNTERTKSTQRTKLYAGDAGLKRQHKPACNLLIFFSDKNSPYGDSQMFPNNCDTFRSLWKHLVPTKIQNQPTQTHNHGCQGNQEQTQKLQNIVHMPSWLCSSLSWSQAVSENQDEPRYSIGLKYENSWCPSIYDPVMWSLLPIVFKFLNHTLWCAPHNHH